MSVEASASRRAADSLVGYRVDGTDGRLGVVEGIRSPLGEGDGAILLVGSGLFVRARTAVPLAQVTEIAPVDRRIVVRTTGAAT